MQCPRCDTASLTEMDRQGITIDRCQSCRGVWLDRGELEKLIARESEDVIGVELDRGAAARGNVEPPRRYKRADSDHDDDDRRHHGKRRSSWWEIFD